MRRCHSPPRSRGIIGAPSRSPGKFKPTDVVLLLGVLWAVLVTGYVLRRMWFVGAAPPQLATYAMAPILISYSYFEKDALQMANFEYFLAAGMQYPSLHSSVHWSIVVSGDACSPCQGIYGMLSTHEASDLSHLGIKDAWYDTKVSLITRTENVGMDLAGHNITLEYMSFRGMLSKFRYFLFLNSSVKGPFWPQWQPPEWHWTHPYLRMLQGDVHAVGSSLVCLPDVDAGGPGPRLESWAFALDQDGLAAAIEGGTFVIRGCKLCTQRDEGVVVGGEYGLTLSMFEAGYNIATLMSKYREGVDWRDPQHWSCNNQVHPSRAGTYDGISFHPYETLFVKASWHVADPYTQRYSAWHLGHLLGQAGTEGTFDEKMYRYAISEAAQKPPDLNKAYKQLAAVS